jgi:hypothetical protein
VCKGGRVIPNFDPVVLDENESILHHSKHMGTRKPGRTLPCRYIHLTQNVQLCRWKGIVRQCPNALLPEYNKKLNVFARGLLPSHAHPSRPEPISAWDPHNAG